MVATPTLDQLSTLERLSTLATLATFPTFPTISAIKKSDPLDLGGSLSIFWGKVGENASLPPPFPSPAHKLHAGVNMPYFARIAP